MARESYESIRRQISKLEAKARAIEAASQEKKSKAVAQVRALMKKLGVDLKDLSAAAPEKASKGGRKRAAAGPKRAAGGARTGTRAAVPAKFRDPATGTTWSGRGRTPVWLSKYLEQGRTKEEFTIAAAAPAAAGE